MKNRIAICLLFVAFASFCGCAKKKEETLCLDQVVRKNETTFICTFDGIERKILLDLPEQTEDAPLVFLLHGYGGSAEGFRTSVHFEEEANALGYGVVYAEGLSNPGDATSSSGWNSGISSTGNRDKEFLVALAEYLQKVYLFDKDRTYAVGFSNGAFMTQRLAMEASDTFSAVVSVAGMMPERVWKARNKKNEVSVFQITGEKDAVVPKHSDGSAEHATAPAIEDVMEYWVTSNELNAVAEETIGKNSVLSKYSSENGKTQVWHLFVKDGYHSWPETDINGIDMNCLILEFFEGLK